MASAVPVFKVTGAGNHFLLVDLRSPKSRQSWRNIERKSSRRNIAREWCNPFEGIGADGLFFLEPDREADAAWDFYNNDGSKAEMCGNAARCVGLYLFESGHQRKSEFSLRTKAGIIKARIAGPETVAVTMPVITGIEWNLQLGKGKKAIPYSFVDSGVPHAVFEVDSLNDAIVCQDFVGAVRKEKRFRAKGVNVTFFQRLNRATLRDSIGGRVKISTRVKSLTFERGVIGYTQACGTGAVAAALVARRGHFGDVSLQVPGGKLKVAINTRPVLTGPAKIVAKIEML